MVAAPRLPVARTGPGRVALRLGDAERRIVGSLAEELRLVLEDPASRSADGALARLFPPAFPDDPDAEASWADLVHADLLDGRRERLALVEATLDAEEIDDAQAAAWLAVVNDLRLVLGASLGIEQDDDGSAPDPDEPDAVRRAVFAWLGWLVGCLVDVLDDALPPVPDEDG